MKSDRYRFFYKLTKHPLLNTALSVTRTIARPPLMLLLAPFLGRVTYFMMGTITNKNCDFQVEPKFFEAYKAAMGQHYMPDTDIWRYHINHWAAKHAMELEGDFVECGVNRGSTAMSNIVYTRFEQYPGRKYYLFDTFNGLDEKVSTKDEYERLKGHYEDCYGFVVRSFSPYPNVVVVRGTVPETLEQMKIERVAYLSIDMNCAYPEEKAMEYFWPKMVKGGVIVLDDYGWPMCEEQKAAADRFAKKVGAMIMCLPNGQGIIIK